MTPYDWQRDEEAIANTERLMEERHYQHALERHEWHERMESYQRAVDAVDDLDMTRIAREVGVFNDAA